MSRAYPPRAKLTLDCDVLQCFELLVVRGEGDDQATWRSRTMTFTEIYLLSLNSNSWWHFREV